MDLDGEFTQAQFADLVGVSQPAISDLQKRGVIRPGQPVRAWLLAYTAHLREQAAGRGADGGLSLARTAESITRNDLLQLQLKKKRGQQIDVIALEQVLAFIGAQVSSKLEPLPAQIKMRCPQLTPEDIKAIDGAITEARNLAAQASLSYLALAAKEEDSNDLQGPLPDE